MFAFGGSKLWNEVLGGFVVNGVYQFQTGAPLQFSADIPLAPGATLRSITNSRAFNGSVTQGPAALNVAAFVTGTSAHAPLDLSATDRRYSTANIPTITGRCRTPCPG